MKSVLFLVSLYRPNVGGVENSVLELAREFHKSGYRVSVVCSDRDYVSAEKLKKFECIEDADIYRFSYPNGFFGFFEQFYNCFRVVRDNDLHCSDVVVARSPVPLISGFFAGARSIKYIVPSVYFFQEKYVGLKSARKILSFLANSFLQFLAFLLAKNYVFSESMRKQVRKASLGIVNARVVKPGVSTSRFFPLSKSDKNLLRLKYDIPANAKVVLGLGRFSEMKQFDQAIKSVEYWNDDTLLLLVGDGPEREHYLDLVNKLSLQDKVRVFPSTTTPERYFQLADFFVMTSRYEAFGQVLLEATCCGLPIIAYPNSHGVQTSVQRIYEGCPNLVTFTRSASPVSLAKEINQAEVNFCSVSFDKESKVLLAGYTWDAMVRTLIDQC